MLDRGAVDELVAGADVVVHLAFIILGGARRDAQHQPRGLAQRLRGDARLDAGRRLVYTSSVAAYGFHEDNPERLTEDVPPRGTEGHYYSAQKAELEGVLGEMLAASRDGRLRLPALHRRRGRRALAASRASPTSGSPSACPLRCAACSRSCRSSSR